ncbi:MAG: radical SAM protein [Candidatus Cloacimonetes bacterium]|nr:radical SAM protein [Candidatus Cloacimonadota bacterium]
MEEVFAEHNRSFEKTRFIYPVISRRSQGLSLGINLDYDKTCNFDCPYCQVNRREFPSDAFDFKTMQAELLWAIEYLQTSEVFDLPRFKSTPASFKVWKDIAIAGDGEPSVNPHLLPTMEFLKPLAAKLPQIVLISNATGLKRPNTQKALEILASMGGVLWAKLDAGTQQYFEIVSGTKLKIDVIEQRILSVPQSLRLCIQICLMKVDGVSPSASEIESLLNRLKRIHNAHKLESIQIYTIARPPAQSFVAPIPLVELKTICQPLIDANLPIKLYSGAAD